MADGHQVVVGHAQRPLAVFRRAVDQGSVGLLPAVELFGERVAALTATTEERPAVPDGLQVYSNLPRSAVLSWKPSETSGVSGYAIYRCPSTAGPWERVVFVEGRLNTVYEDTVPGDLRVMYYRISAVNRFGGESLR